jgi:hypothetical protein
MVHEIVMDDSIKEKNSTFIEPPLYVAIDFNTFNTNLLDLKDRNLNGFTKNVIPIILIS